MIDFLKFLIVYSTLFVLAWSLVFFLWTCSLLNMVKYQEKETSRKRAFEQLYSFDNPDA